MKNLLMISFALIISISILASCSDNNEDTGISSFVGQDIAIEEVQPVDQTYEPVSLSGESIFESDQTEELDENNVIDVSDCDYESLSDFFASVDTERNSSDEYMKAVEAYESLITDIYNIAAENDFFEVPHFGVAYIDDKDDIPELLVSYGNSHPCGVCVYRYDSSLSKVLYLGEFGSFGGFLFYEKKNLIECFYGNHECYTYYLCKIVEGTDQPELIESWIIDGSGINSDKIAYFHGYVMDERINGSRESFEQNELNELYINADMSQGYYLTEEEFNEELLNWIGESEDNAISISYDDMYTVKFKK